MTQRPACFHTNDDLTPCQEKNAILQIPKLSLYSYSYGKFIFFAIELII